MRKILLVEDDDLLRETFTLIITTQPYQLDSAPDGQVALDLCKKTDYDLILLDLMMPVLDGAGFLRKFTPNRPAKTKILILSNISSGKDLDEAVSLGAERSVLKASLTPKEILSMIRYELDAA